MSAKSVSRIRATLLAGAAVAGVIAGSPALAQDEASQETSTVGELIVTGDIAFRNRTTDVNPVLEYELEYFQRFEPVSVGEMLKRVPGVTFTSDVLEFDGVSLRGLPPGYTQVLINGRRAPGGENDRSFFVDRLPAELVDRIEIIRSPRADQPSDGMAGSLNIILKEGATLRGGLAKIGALINEDGELRPSAAIAYADGDDATSWWAGLNYQGRRNPKKKVTEFFDGDFGSADGVEFQDDTRDGVDISANGEFTHKFDGGRLRFTGLIVDTDRDEDELSLVYDDLARTSFDEAEIQAERIKQRTYAFGFDSMFEVAGGRLDFDLGWNAYDEDSSESVDVAGLEDLSDRELDEYTKLDIEDREWDAGAAYTFEGDGWRVKTGLDYLVKSRDFAEVEFDIAGGAIDDPDPAPGAVHQIEEKRLDPYVRVTLEPNDRWTFDLGLRYENTTRDVTSDLGGRGFREGHFNPSFHASWRASENALVRFSLARTVRRPDYDLLAPYIAIEEPTDDDALRGNPDLQVEQAWGWDLGVEYRIGERGIFGANLFYRDIDNLIETVNTGLDVNGAGQVVTTGTRFNLYEARNVGDGQTWGIEFDLSAPLDGLGLPNTGVFANYTILESEVRDPFTKQLRPFTNLPDRVYNVGFVHNLPAWDVSFGASLYGRSEGQEQSFDEDVTVDYDDDLEAFVEKRFGDRFVLRLAAMNLLDKEKRETFRAYDGDSIDEIIAERLAGSIDESERETERSGVLYQVTFRAAF